MSALSSSRAFGVVAVLVAVSAGACGRDYDGLFDDKNGASSGTTGTIDKDSGSSGSSGGACACSPCKAGSTACKLACPKGCTCPPCEVFVCPLEAQCQIDCASGTSCDVDCIDGAQCTVTCAADAQCACIGAGCDIQCDGKASACIPGKTAACNRACPK